MDIVGVDEDRSLFENGTVAWLLFSVGMCNVISMSFGVGKPPTTRQISWARLRKYSYCLGLTGRHRPHQGRDPVSAMHRRIQGGPGGTCPPRPFEKRNVFCYYRVNVFFFLNFCLCSFLFVFFVNWLIDS